MLEDAISEQVLQGTFKEGDVIETMVEDGKVVFVKVPGKVSKPVEKGDKDKDKEEAKTSKTEKSDKPEKASKSKDSEKSSEKETVE